MFSLLTHYHIIFAVLNMLFRTAVFSQTLTFVQKHSPHGYACYPETTH